MRAKLEFGWRRGRRARTLRILAAVAAIVVTAVAPHVARAEDPAKPEGYVCPPCGCGEDGKIVGEAGTCTVCRMKLIKESELKRAVILIYDGADIMDYTGPWEVFGTAGFEVVTVSKTSEPITTAMGMVVTPRHTFKTSPKPTIVLVPGGRGTDAVASDPETLDWIRQAAGAAQHVLAVTNGVFVLAGAGLLDNQKATTFTYMLEDLETAAPGIQVVADRRYVESGKVVTAAGSSSAIDAALHVVSRIRSLSAAQRVALHLDYDWAPGSSRTRAALAERYMPRLTGRDWDGVEMLSTSGDQDRWESRYRMKTDAAATALLGKVKSVLETMRQWSAPAPAEQGNRAEGSWKFVDDAGAPWTGKARVEPAEGDAGAYSITIQVDRDRREGPRG